LIPLAQDSAETVAKRKIAIQQQVETLRETVEVKRNRKHTGLTITATTQFGPSSHSPGSASSGSQATVLPPPAPASMQLDASGVPGSAVQAPSVPIASSPMIGSNPFQATSGTGTQVPIGTNPFQTVPAAGAPQPSLHGPWSNPRAQSTGDIRVSQSQRGQSTGSWDRWSSSEWASGSDYTSGWRRQGRAGVRPATWSSSSPNPTDWSSWSRSGSQSWDARSSGVNLAKQHPYSAESAQLRGRSPPSSGVNLAREGAPTSQGWTPTLRPSSGSS